MAWVHRDREQDYAPNQISNLISPPCESFLLVLLHFEFEQTDATVEMHGNHRNIVNHWKQLTSSMSFKN